jgi:arylsulfatase A-like enzyme
MFLGEHGFVGKWTMHEESIHVPFIVRYPRLPKAMHGKTLDQLVLNLDIAPTFLDFANAKIPRETDGRSLSPLLTGRAGEWRKDFFYEHHYHHGGRIARTEGVRTESWAYMTYFDMEPAYEELYDLKNDPLQADNRARGREPPPALEALRGRYREYVKELPPAVLPNKTPAKEKGKG